MQKEKKKKLMQRKEFALKMKLICMVNTKKPLLNSLMLVAFDNIKTLVN